MNAEEAYIVEMLNSDISIEQLVSGLQQNFNYKNELSAKNKISEFIANQQLITDAFQDKKLKIKYHPGFKTIFLRDKYSSKLSTTISGIDNIKYLDILESYIVACIMQWCGPR